MPFLAFWTNLDIDTPMGIEFLVIFRGQKPLREQRQRAVLFERSRIQHLFKE